MQPMTNMTPEEYDRLVNASLMSQGVGAWLAVGIVLLVPLPPVGLAMIIYALVNLHRKKKAYQARLNARALEADQRRRDAEEDAMISTARSLP